MEGENNIDTVKIDINGKIRGTDQDGERERLLEAKSWIESWIALVKSRKYKERKTSAGVSIYRVPECMKKTKREAYDPLVVFLGPYHHKKNQQLTAVDEYKLQAVNRILERLPGMTIEGLVAKVSEKEIRVCYEDSAAEWAGDTPAWIMTMDACFILEFLRMDIPSSSLVFHSQRGDNIKRQEIMCDIMKLENQIPFFILIKILELELEDPEAVPAFLAKQLYGCIGGYFRGHPFSLEINEKVISKLIEGHPHHLLDLSRRVIADFLSSSGFGSESALPDKSCGCTVLCGAASCIATPNGVACFKGKGWKAAFPWLFPSSAGEGDLIPSAEKLQKAGIKLKASTEGKFHFKHGCFQRSTLFVPQIVVDDNTEIFLRNLVAFEECQKHTDSPIKRVISSNMCVIDQLIDSKEDVKLLQKADIIKNYLGSEDEVAKIFNDLCIGVSTEDYYTHVLTMVKNRYKNQLSVWISEFREEYCSKPWYIVSFVVAVFISVLTLLQTIYTMKGW